MSEREVRSDALGRVELPVLQQSTTRRVVFKGVGAALGLAAFAMAISPLWTIPENVSLEEFLQHYKELSEDEKEKVFTRLESHTLDRYGA